MNTELYNAIAAIDPEAAEKYKRRLPWQLRWNPFSNATLLESFTWGKTPEGHRYWSDINAKLSSRPPRLRPIA